MVTLVKLGWSMLVIFLMPVILGGMGTGFPYSRKSKTEKGFLARIGA